MKYQSEVLKEIIDKEGHITSLLHYESECIEHFIDENKGGYPKLIDYQSEWLNYINEKPIGKFPYITLNNVTNATVENVVPYAYKSAILKGSTKYRDIDTGEVLDAFEDGRNLELVSVKMPVLTTSNFNNLFNLNGNINEFYDTMAVNQSNNEIENGKLKTLALNTVSHGKGQRIKIKPNTTITVSAFVEGDYGGEMAINFPNENNIWFNGSGLISKTIDTKENTEMIISFKTCRHNQPAYFSKIQVEENVAEPTSDTKTNILTVNEDIELRAIGDIRDELDCLTGEYVQRLGERTFVGNDDENWTLRNTFTNTILFANDNLGLNGFTDYALSNTKMICDKFICGAYENQDIEFVCMRFTGQGVMIGISSSKLATQNVVGFKQWLTQNPITIQYHLAAESVKTVDLTVTNQDGETVQFKPIEGTMHVSTSGETIKPTFSGEIPVEAITQNLESFIGDE